MALGYQSFYRKTWRGDGEGWERVLSLLLR